MHANNGDYEATTRSHLATHIQCVHEGKKYQCEVCNKEYTENMSLRRHKKSVHEGKKYQCKVCDRKYTDTGALL